MEEFIVGGAVRDQLLGLVPKDMDHVVVGATPEEMIEKGFLSVGLSYPVFLHPVTREEYVLASDLKTDLLRRDLTINAIALSPAGEFIDFFGGKRDLEERILRHVSDSFLDDPLRVYRVARFRAQFSDFTIAEETVALMREAVTSSMLARLPGERIFGELRKALEARRPSLFFETLQTLSAQHAHFGELSLKTLNFVERAARLKEGPVLPWALLVSDLEEEKIIALSQRLLVPNIWLEAGLTLAKHQLDVRHIFRRTPAEIVHLLSLIDAFRRPALMEVLSRGCEILFDSKVEVSYLDDCFHRALEVGVSDVDPELKGREIGEAIREERIKRVNTLALDCHRRRT